MNALVISTHNKSEYKLISDILKRMRISAKVLTEEQMEDMGMAYLMSEADRNNKVSRESVIKKLKKK